MLGAADEVAPHAPTNAPPRHRFGPVLDEAGCLFRLWAPFCDGVMLRLDESDRRVMAMAVKGWFELYVPGVTAGQTYDFVLSDGTTVPDPASSFQPTDVHGPSEVIDHAAFVWSDAGWQAPEWHTSILYELHVGTFTPEGTFRAAIGKLDHLAALGITAIELMPLHAFPGAFGWSYDGVSLYAPNASYGRPDDLKALVDAAHARGLMVFLDVVYNHFGPEGNYLPHYAPVLSLEHENDYGQGVNVDGPEAETVRDFLIGNALYLLDAFHIDGLRFDAIHVIEDDGPKHFLEDMAEIIRASFPDRRLHLVVENSRNEAGWLKRGPGGSPAYYEAQWSDDIHNAMHVVATGEQIDYYANYADPVEKLGRALAEGFSYQGQYRPTNAAPLGEPSAHLPPTAFVACLQNHDQIGNRPLGDRLSRTVPPHIVKALTTLYLLSPTIPMLFQGEEFDATSPFPFFTDVSDDLKHVIRESRLKTLADWPEVRNGVELPDPFDPQTLQSARLDWAECVANADRLAFFRKLIALRKAEIVPRLAGIAGHAGSWNVTGGSLLDLNWRLADGSTLRIIANLGDATATPASPWREGRIWLTGLADAETLSGWSVVAMLLPAKA